jgi:hypothetical protein
MENRTIDDLQLAVKNHEVNFLPHDKCSYCDYVRGFVFIDRAIFYDSGCKCGGDHNKHPHLPNHSKLTSTDWSYFAYMYNRSVGAMRDKFDRVLGFKKD